MNKEKTKSNTLFLSLLDSDFQAEILDFDGCIGKLANKISDLDDQIIHRAKITSNSGAGFLWSGEIRIDPCQEKFELLVRSSLEPDTDIKWSELPKVLSVFDGGYRALGHNEIERLLSDLIEFHALVSCKVHLQTSNENRYFTAGFTEQENLRKLTEILVQIPDAVASEVLKKATVYVLEIELFEVTYFLITTMEESEDDLFIFRLTDHFYGHSKREGRRIHLSGEEVNIPEGRVLEVSDFGMKVDFLDRSLKIGSEICLSINSSSLKFKCIFADGSLAGLKLLDFSAEARKAWQSFLLPFQYPNLVFRVPELHERTWKLFEEVGYFNLPHGVGDLVAKNKNTIFKEWTRVDDSGPDQGIATISLNQGSPIGTIGVNRVGRGIWLSQALATSKDPKYIAHTRSLYAWRTRSIIQQPDGHWNLAFFSSEKAFLDRFFRKFLLLLTEDEADLVSWEEKNHYFFIPHCSESIHCPADRPPRHPTSKFLAEFESSDDDVVTKSQFGNSTSILTPPHLSVAQMVVSLWAIDLETVELEKFSKLLLERGHTFASLFLDTPIYTAANHQKAENIVGGHSIVVWMCARALLPKFLANSLRAFELMHAKYGAQEVA